MLSFIFFSLDIFDKFCIFLKEGLFENLKKVRIRNQFTAKCVVTYKEVVC